MNFGREWDSDINPGSRKFKWNDYLKDWKESTTSRKVENHIDDLLCLISCKSPHLEQMLLYIEINNDLRIREKFYEWYFQFIGKLIWYCIDKALSNSKSLNRRSHSEPCKTFMIEIFVEIVNAFQPSIIFSKTSILDVRQSIKYASATSDVVSLFLAF